MKKKLNILICPLEWGLGHAGRMIALALRLREMDNNVIIGTGKEHQLFFIREIPGIPCIDLPGFKPFYSRYLPQYLMVLLSIPVLLFYIIAEHYRLNKVIRKNPIDIVISDNRFGLWNKKIKTVYVTHQLRILFPKVFRIFEFIGLGLHRVIINKYDHCFIPDLPGRVNLSGRLSHGIRLPANAIYTGILSRFSSAGPMQVSLMTVNKYNLVIMSGPEPQRSLLRQKLEHLFENYETSTVFLGGDPSCNTMEIKKGNLIYYNHLPTDKMKEMIHKSEYIITRAGYTSIMELISLNRTALLIATPGQTEQEYLARHLQENGWFKTIRQKDLKNGLALSGASILPPFTEIISESRRLLEEALKKLSEQDQK